MSSKNFSRIDKIIKQTADHYKLQDAIHRYKVLKTWQSVACGFFDRAAELTKAINFNKGVLRVACLSREIALQLKILAPRLVEAINEVLGRRLVFAIAVEV